MKLASNKLFAFILTFFQFALICAQNHPIPALLDTSKYGRYTSRTLNLLQTSSPGNRNTVRILVYGQSISAQNWWLEVKKDIEKKFPHANLIMENKAIGGFASQILIKTVEMDVSSFYPDLVLLHIYGSDKMYDSVLYTIRSRTAAEVAIQTDHYTGLSRWSDTMSYHILPALAKKYKCDLINIRDPWKQYLRDNNLDTSKLLSDAVHLNEYGNFLMAELIKPLFKTHSSFEVDPFQLKKVLKSGKDFKPGKSIKIEFTGNRVDLVLETGKSGSEVQVLVDGKKPSEFQGTYFMTRPFNSSGKAWPWNLPAMIRIQHSKPWVNEDWTLTFTDAKPPYEKFTFEINGSVTGNDGVGNSTEDFYSPSGKVIIRKGDADEGGDWHLSRSYKVMKTEVKTGDVVHWKTYSISTDRFKPDGSTLTLFQGVPNSRHTLSVTWKGKGNIPLKEVVVYSPFIKSIVL